MADTNDTLAPETEVGAPAFTPAEWGIIQAAIADQSQALRNGPFVNLSYEVQDLADRIETYLEAIDPNG